MGTVDRFAAVHTTWFLLAWGVVAAASIWKFWTLRPRIAAAAFGWFSIRPARQTLERAWQKSVR